MGSALLSLARYLRGRATPVGEWDRIIEVANKTLVTATLAERIAAAPDDPAVPSDVRSFLTAILARNLARNRQLLTQLSDVVAHLNRAGVEPILIKGSAMVAEADEDSLGARMLSDLDLLVPPSKVAACAETLLGMGYAIDTKPTDGRLPLVLSRARDVGTIDLHSRLRIPAACSDYASLRRHSRQRTLGKGRALVPSATIQAMILILHDQLQDRDYWRGLIDLRHLLDLDRLARSPEGIDWALLVSLFPPGYARGALRTQLLTARNLLGVEVPPALVAGIRPSLQYRRRILQAAWPRLMGPLTTLTVLSDYPRFPHEATPAEGTPPRGSIAGWKRSFQRFFQAASPGKA